jgi:hypothetical protein
MKTKRKQNILAVMLAGALASTGCNSIGPSTVSTDQFDSITAIADSWKQQVLLNIVKLRYLDLPVLSSVVYHLPFIVRSFLVAQTHTSTGLKSRATSILFANNSPTRFMSSSRGN